MQSMTLPAPWRKLLLTVHVAATVSVLGTDLVLLALGLSSLSGADPRTIYPAAHLVSARLVVPLAVLSLGTGLLLGILTPWGLLRYWWVAIKLAITAVLTGVVLFVLVPRLGAAADAVTGPGSHLLTIGERLPLVVAPAVASTLLALNVVLAIFKPGWRLRSCATGAAARLRTQPEEPTGDSSDIGHSNGGRDDLSQSGPARGDDCPAGDRNHGRQGRVRPD